MGNRKGVASFMYLHDCSTTRSFTTADAKQCVSQNLANGMHTTSYSTLKGTMRLPCMVFKISHAIYQKSSILTYPNCIWCPRWG